jgi:hypothetical protein
MTEPVCPRRELKCALESMFDLRELPAFRSLSILPITIVSYGLSVLDRPFCVTGPEGIPV